MIWHLPCSHINRNLIQGKQYRVSFVFEGTKTMEWTAPTFEEVALNCEINSYASAAL
jgi:coenzyme PQQ precursor peptide PqqA